MSQSAIRGPLQPVLASVAFKVKGGLTMRALDGWDSAPSSSFIYTRTESCSRSFIHARPPASNANRWALSDVCTRGRHEKTRDC
jgi:hypothetical protein